MHINASCGGEGVCGKCRVRVESGEVQGGISERLSPADVAKGLPASLPFDPRGRRDRAHPGRVDRGCRRPEPARLTAARRPDPAFQPVRPEAGGALPAAGRKALPRTHPARGGRQPPGREPHHRPPAAPFRRAPPGGRPRAHPQDPGRAAAAGVPGDGHSRAARAAGRAHPPDQPAARRHQRPQLRDRHGHRDDHHLRPGDRPGHGRGEGRARRVQRADQLRRGRHRAHRLRREAGRARPHAGSGGRDDQPHPAQDRAPFRGRPRGHLGHHPGRQHDHDPAAAPGRPASDPARALRPGGGALPADEGPRPRDGTGRARHRAGLPLRLELRGRGHRGRGDGLGDLPGRGADALPGRRDQRRDRDRQPRLARLRGLLGRPGLRGRRADLRHARGRGRDRGLLARPRDAASP